MQGEQVPGLSAAVSAAAIKAAPIIAAIAGSFVGFSTFKHLNSRGRYTSLACGALIAMFVGPAAIEQYLPGSSPAMVNFIHFAIGVFGLTLVPSVAVLLKRYMGVTVGVLRENEQERRS